MQIPFQNAPVTAGLFILLTTWFTIVTAWNIHGTHNTLERLQNVPEWNSRRAFLSTVSFETAVIFLSRPVVAMENNATRNMEPPDDYSKPFRSAAYSLKEYTNSIVASRDTNVSPLEVYETLLQKLKPAVRTNTNGVLRRALDVGAGAGVSTQVMWDMGYQEIDAVDWSGDAWQKNVVEEGHCPPTVNFYAMDDERFVEQHWKKQQLPKYDAIAFNFAVNQDKALLFCQTLLNDDGLLLAPINAQKDYWLKQTYQLLDAQGKVVWSAADVGAWSVQFQPDVTQDTCQGVWCPPYNGFQKMKSPI